MGKYSCVLIQAGDWDDDDYQAYYNEAGERIPAGEDIGVEIQSGGKEAVLYLLDFIYID